MNCRIIIALLLLAQFSLAAENLARNARTLASSCKGDSGRTVKTAFYHTNLNDGKPDTVWRPMDPGKKHWIELGWRYPVHIGQVRIHGKGYADYEVKYWDGNDYPVLPQSGAYTSRLRVEFAAAANSLEIAEIEITGPEQPVTPVRFPDAKAFADIAPIKVDRVSIDRNTVKLNIENPRNTPGTLLLDMVNPAQLNTWLGDYEVASAAAVLPPGNSEVVLELIIPEFAPAGETPLYLRLLDAENKKFIRLTDGGGKALDKIGVINIEPQRRMEDIHFSSASIGTLNGQLGFQIDRQFKMPFFFRYMKSSPYEALFNTAASGIDIQYFLMYNRVLGLEDQWQVYLNRFDENIRALLSVNPNCYIIAAMDLRPNPNWLNAHPQELALDIFGRKPSNIKGEPGMVSFGSDVYMKDCKAFIDRFFEFLKDKDYASRIIGYMPNVCTQLDSHIGGVEANMMIDDRDKLTYGDFHPGAIAKFRQWLRTRYHSDTDALRKAWQLDDVTFENALPSRQALWAMNPDGGVFRDPRQFRQAIDYMEFFPSLLGNFNLELTGCIKQKTNHKALTLLHYGATFATLRNAQPSGSRIHVQNYDFANLLASDNIDMYVYAPNYHSRQAGDPYLMYLALDSIALHKRLGMADNDERTFSASGLLHGKHRGVAETDAVLKRDLAFHIIKNGGAWLADMGGRPNNVWNDGDSPWFGRKEVVDVIRTTLAAMNPQNAPERKSASEIAVFASLNTPRYEDPILAVPLYYNLVQRMYWRELQMIGAPYDVYLTSDLDHPELKKDYKLYIFLNPFYLSKTERAAIEKLKHGRKTLLWFYAPGYIDDAEGLSLRRMSELTGMTMKIKPDKEIPQLKINKSRHPLDGRSYTAPTYSDNSWSRMHPGEITPVFYVDDPNADKLGFYSDGKAAMAVRDFGSWRSVYTAVPFLDTRALREIAREAGVNIYTEEDIFMTADNRFMMFTNGYQKERILTVRLPHPANVSDAVTGELLCRGSRTFKLKLAAPQTRLLRFD
jgi:hypothetical protein